MLGHAQESVGSLVETAEDIAQEVRGQCSLSPCHETRGVGCRKREERTGNPGHLSSVVVWGCWGERGKGAPGGGPCLVIAWWWGHVEGKPAQPSGDPLLQAPGAPNLGELWALLQRPHGQVVPGGGGRSPLQCPRAQEAGGPSLSWYEASDLEGAEQAGGQCRPCGTTATVSDQFHSSPWGSRARTWAQGLMMPPPWP